MTPQEHQLLLTRRALQNVTAALLGEEPPHPWEEVPVLSLPANPNATIKEYLGSPEISAELKRGPVLSCALVNQQHADLSCTVVKHRHVESPYCIPIEIYIPGSEKKEDNEK